MGKDWALADARGDTVENYGSVGWDGIKIIDMLVHAGRLKQSMDIITDLLRRLHVYIDILQKLGVDAVVQSVQFEILSLCRR